MAIRLEITDTRNSKEHFSRTFVQHKVTIGRARYCDICLPDLSVSTSHVDIRLQESDFYLVDTGSANGTFIQGKKLVAHRPKKLLGGDVFMVAHFRIRFELGVSQGPAPERHLGQNHALKMLSAVLSMTSIPVTPTLVILSGPDKGKRFELLPSPSVAVIGRSRQADIPLEDRQLSRRHAEVIRENDTIVIRNVNPRALILHNEQKEDVIVLQSDSTVTMGETTLALEHPLDPSLLHIQNAPEEETASFCTNLSFFNEAPEAKLASLQTDSSPTAPSKGQSDVDVDDSDGDSLASSAAAPATDASDTDPMASLPTGPSDPLQVNEPVMPDEMILPEDEKSDLGLIVVGAIVVVSCVLILVWLLT